MKIKTRTWLRACSLALLQVAPHAGIAQTGAPPARGPLPTESLRAFVDTVGLLQSSYIKPLSAEELLQAAIRGMVREVDPEGGDALTSADTGSGPAQQEGLGGAGLEMTVRDGSVVVVAPLPNSPAEQAGIKPKDVLVSIDGVPVRDRLAWAAKALRGSADSQVTIAIRQSASPPATPSGHSTSNASGSSR